jgi:hypothetical protein
MIVNKTYDVGDVISIKISSGEELVAKLVSISSTDFILNRPLALGMTQQGPAFTPYMVTVDFKHDDLTLARNHVVAVTKTVEQVKQSYTQSVTGIAMPEKPSVII